MLVFSRPRWTDLRKRRFLTVGLGSGLGETI